MSGTLAQLAAHFALLSLIMVGGGNSVIPEMHRQAVEVGQWMTDRQFADFYAIAQAAPGPNVLVVTLIGFHVAGLPGALVSTLAICAPSCLLTFAVVQTWERFRNARWRPAVQAGITPVVIGVVGASAFILARAADHNLAAFAITAATAALAYFTRLNPLWALGAGAALGIAGLV